VLYEEPVLVLESLPEIVKSIWPAGALSAFTIVRWYTLQSARRRRRFHSKTPIAKTPPAANVSSAEQNAPKGPTKAPTIAISLTSPAPVARIK